MCATTRHPDARLVRELQGAAMRGLAVERGPEVRVDWPAVPRRLRRVGVPPVELDVGVHALVLYTTPNPVPTCSQRLSVGRPSLSRRTFSAADPWRRWAAR